MKEIRVKMTAQFESKASKPIRNKHDLILLLLEATTLLQHGKKQEDFYDRQLILRVDKMKRLIFFMRDKIFSFNFPFQFNISETENYNVSFYDSHTDVELSSANLSMLKTIYEELLRENLQPNLSDFDSEVTKILETFGLYENQDHLWYMLKSLLVFEDGYLRYDHDPDHEDGDLHPLHHIDINYSSASTFKIGLAHQITSHHFIDILDINTNCYFIGK